MYKARITGIIILSALIQTSLMMLGAPWYGPILFMSGIFSVIMIMFHLIGMISTNEWWPW